jgi:hypothetical protein
VAQKHGSDPWYCGGDSYLLLCREVASDGSLPPVHRLADTIFTAVASARNDETSLTSDMPCCTRIARSWSHACTEVRTVDACSHKQLTRRVCSQPVALCFCSMRTMQHDTLAVGAATPPRLCPSMKLRVDFRRYAAERVTAWTDTHALSSSELTDSAGADRSSPAPPAPRECSLWFIRAQEWLVIEAHAFY